METCDVSALGAKIKHALTHHQSGKMTQAILAERMGVSQSAVSEWIRGKSSPKDKYRLAKVLSINIEELLDETDPPSPPAASHTAIAAPDPSQMLLAQSLITQAIADIEEPPRRERDKLIRRMAAIIASDTSAKSTDSLDVYLGLAKQMTRGALPHVVDFADGVKVPEQEVLPPIKKLEKGKKE